MWVLTKSTTDQIFCIHQILEKRWEYKLSQCSLVVCNNFMFLHQGVDLT